LQRDVWRREDGGKKGTIAFLKKHELLPQDADPKVIYNDYDWSVRSGNYR